jgi:DNA-binding winged helix-turn-helix (wHTH) protein/tetratricopeptide (TPR) repeat protein
MRAPSQQRVVRFDAFTIDLLRCVLHRGSVEIRLRRQAFDMLRYLAEHPGRLVPKDELIAAVWRKEAVSDDSLVRCVRDIREALGDQDQRIVKTVRGRGYLFAAELLPAEVDAGGEPAPGAPSAPTPPGALPSIAVTPPEAPELSSPWARLPTRSLLNAVPWHRVSARWCAAAAVVAIVLVAAAVGGLWRLSTQPIAGNASHYAILGSTILANERSAKANREALALFTKALALDPNTVPALLGYAQVMILDVREAWAPDDEHRRRLDQAEAAIRRALALRPEHPRAHHMLGFLLRARGEQDGALAAFQHAAALNPHSAWTRAEIGRSKINVGRADEAMQDIEAAILMKPSERDIHIWYYWAGLAAVLTGKHEAAIHWLLKAQEAHGTPYGVSALLLAAAYAELGRENEGRAVLAEYLTKRPGLSMSILNHDFPDQNAALARSRARLADVLRRLGLSEAPPVEIGAVR